MPTCSGQMQTHPQTWASPGAPDSLTDAHPDSGQARIPPSSTRPLSHVREYHQPKPGLIHCCQVRGEPPKDPMASLLQIGSDKGPAHTRQKRDRRAQNCAKSRMASSRGHGHFCYSPPPLAEAEGWRFVGGECLADCHPRGFYGGRKQRAQRLSAEQESGESPRRKGLLGLVTCTEQQDPRWGRGMKSLISAGLAAAWGGGGSEGLRLYRRGS